MYFDPGIGSLIIQVLIGILVAVPAFFGLWWWKLRKLFGRGKHED